MGIHIAIFSMLNNFTLFMSGAKSYLRWLHTKQITVHNPQSGSGWDEEWVVIPFFVTDLIKEYRFMANFFHSFEIQKIISYPNLYRDFQSNMK